MSTTRFRRHLLAAALALTASAAVHAADADRRAVLVDIRTSTAAEVDAWRTAAGVDWWLELGDELLLSGDVGAMRAAVDADIVLRDLGPLQPADLVLHSRGCSAGTAPADLLLWPGQRHDLLLKPDPSRLGEFDDEHADEARWVAVAPNSVVERQYRLDRPLALPADPLVQPLVDAVDVERWYQGVVTLAGWSRSTFSTELVAARQWIAAEFAALGFEVSEPAFTFVYGSSTHSSNNVIGFLRGTTRPDDWYIVGGHYDSRQQSITTPTNSPGADDNASGCSGVIEAARIFSRFRPQASLMFMCYSGEEQNLYGSKAHVSALQASGDFGKLRGVATMDMIGWSPNATLGIFLETTTAHVAFMNLFADAALTYAPELAMVNTGTAPCCSDHAPYLSAGKPAVLSIHRNYSSYPHYHRTTDTPANLGAWARQIGGAIVRTNVAAVAALSGASDRIFADGLDPP